MAIDYGLPDWGILNVMRIVKTLHRHLGAILMIGVITGLFVTGALLLWAATLSIPDLESFEQRKVEQSTKIYDRTGEVLLFNVHENVKRTVVGWDNISHHVKNATVATEDEAF